MLKDLRGKYQISIENRQDVWCIFYPPENIPGAVPGGRPYVVMEAGQGYLYQTGYVVKYRLEMNAMNKPAGEFVLLSEADDVPEWYEGQDLTGKSLVLLRQGGIGDLIMLTPLINGLRRLYPDCRIGFATAIEYSTILEGVVDRVVSLPMSAEVFRQYDYFLHFTETIEKSPGDPDKPATDMFIEVAGHDPAEFPKSELTGIPHFSCNIEYNARRRADITKHVAIRYDPTEDILVAVQPRSNNIVRNIPPETVREMLLMMSEKQEGFRFVPMLLDRKREIEYVSSRELPYLVDFRGKTYLKDYIALISVSDMVIAPDSSAVHIAGAFGIPTVALYGAFTPTSRTSYYPKCRAVVGGVRETAVSDELYDRIGPCYGCMNQEGCTNTDIRGYTYCMLDTDGEEIRNAIKDAAYEVIKEK